LVANVGQEDANGNGVGDACDTAIVSSSGSSGSDGKGGTMVTWHCTDWSSCSVDGTQTRSCDNSVGVETMNYGRPVESRACVYVAPKKSSRSSSCPPVWECSDWGECVNGVQSRTCTDTASCTIESGKPAESKECVIAPGSEGNSITGLAVANSGKASPLSLLFLLPIALLLYYYSKNTHLFEGVRKYIGRMRKQLKI
jgi:hypothetical protein